MHLGSFQLPVLKLQLRRRKLCAHCKLCASNRCCCFAWRPSTLEHWNYNQTLKVTANCGPPNNRQGIGKNQETDANQDSPRIHTNSKTPLATVHFVVLAPGPKICKNTVEVLLQAARRIAIQAFWYQIIPALAYNFVEQLKQKEPAWTTKTAFTSHLFKPLFKTIFLLGQPGSNDEPLMVCRMPRFMLCILHMRITSMENPGSASHGPGIKGFFTNTKHYYIHVTLSTQANYGKQNAVIVAQRAKFVREYMGCPIPSVLVLSVCPRCLRP